MASEWVTYSFLDLLSNIVDNRGKTCPTDESGLPLIATNCVKNDTLYPVFEKVRYVNEETYKSWFRGHPEPGDMIFVCKGSPGNVCLTPDPVNFCIAQDMVAIRANSQIIDPKFLFALLRTSETKARIINMHVGTLIPHFKKGDFKNLYFKIPKDIGIQKSIGQVYYDFCKKIDLNRRMNETLEAMARALFKSWFVDFDPVIDNALRAGNPIPEELSEKAARRKQILQSGKYPPLPPEITTLFPASFEDSELGYMPTGWKIKRLSEIAQVVDCLHSKKPKRLVSGNLLIQVFNVGACGILDFSDPYFISNEDYALWTSRIEISPGDLVITKTGRVGAVGQMTKGMNAAMGRNMVGIRAKENVSTPCFLKELLLSDKMKLEITRNTNDGTILKSLHVKAINVLKFLYSGYHVVQKFDELVKKTEEQIESNYTQIFSLSFLRDTLLPRLISGELIITDAAKYTEVDGW